MSGTCGAYEYGGTYFSYAPRCEVVAAPQTDLRDGTTAGARGVAGLAAGSVARWARLVQLVLTARWQP
jgi:hypothetical protein